MLEFLWFYTDLLAFAIDLNAVWGKELKESRKHKRYTGQCYKCKRVQAKPQQILPTCPDP